MATYHDDAAIPDPERLAEPHSLDLTSDELRVIARALDLAAHYLRRDDTDRDTIAHLADVIRPAATDVILAAQIARREAKKDQP